MSININQLLNKSIQSQEAAAAAAVVEESVNVGGADLSAFAINLEGVAMEQSTDMSSIRAALGCGMAINTVLEARHQ